MGDPLDELINTSYELLRLSKEVMHSCRLKKNKRISASRLIISFFLRRAQETFEAFLVLLRQHCVVDASLLLRSFAEVGINTAYIFYEEKEKEKRSLQYIIEGDDAQRRLIASNIEAFKKFDPAIESRSRQLKESVRQAKDDFEKNFPGVSSSLPPINQRATQTGINILDSFYNQVYRFYSNVEHASMFFGRNYVDEKKCEPLENPKDITESPLFDPKVLLFLFRIIYFEILKAFNNEYKLNWEKKIFELYKRHESEYSLLKKR